MPKNIKPENVISEEDKSAIGEGTKTVKQVSTEKNIPYQSVYNQVKKGKLAVTFEKNDQSGVAPTPQFDESIQEEKIIDYTPHVAGFWSFVDMIFRFIAPLFNLEYNAMSNEDINDLTEKTKDKLGKFISGHSYIDWLGTVGSIGFAFISRIKVKPKESKKNIVAQTPDNRVLKESIHVEPKQESKKVVEIKQELKDLGVQEYKTNEEGLVISDLTPEQIKAKLGI